MAFKQGEQAKRGPRKTVPAMAVVRQRRVEHNTAILCLIKAAVLGILEQLHKTLTSRHRQIRLAYNRCAGGCCAASGEGQADDKAKQLKTSRTKHRHGDGVQDVALLAVLVDAEAMALR